MNEKFSPNKSNKKSKFEEGKEINKNKHDILNLNLKNNLYQTNFQCIPHRLLSDNAMLKKTHFLLSEKIKSKYFKEPALKENNSNNSNKNYNLNDNSIKDNTSKNNNNSKNDIIYKIENKKKCFLCIPCF